MKSSGAASLALLALAAAAGCRRSPPPDPAAVAAPLAVALSGCDAVSQGAVCEVVPDALLRVIAPTGGGVRVRFDDGVDVAIGRVVTGEGWTRLHVTVPFAAATTVTVVADDGRSATLPLARSQRPQWLRDAQRLRREGDAAGAAAIAQAHLADPGADGARALGLQARLALAKGATEEAIELLQRSSERLAAAGRPSEAMEDRLARSYALTQIVLRFADARKTLADPPPDAGADAAVNVEYYRALVDLQTGDARSALDRLERVKRDAERLGLEAVGMDAEEMIGLALVQIGRVAEGHERVRALRAADRDAPPCRRADRALNLARATRVAKPDLSGLAESTALLEEALALVRTTCPSTLREPNVLVELADDAVARGDAKAAAARLEEVRRVEHEPAHRITLARERLSAGVALLAGNARKALAGFTRTVELAAAIGDVETLHAAQVGRAEALEALGRFDDAIAAYREAERHLDTLAVLAPAGSGGGIFGIRGERSARGLVDVLVRRGRVAEALDAARAAHARALRASRRSAEIAALSPDARAEWERAVTAYRVARGALEAAATKDWTLSAADLAHARAARKAQEDALRAALERALALVAHGAEVALAPRAIAKGSGFVTWHRGRAASWVFLATDAEVIARDAIESAPLDAVADRIATLDRLIVLPPPRARLARTDLHALPYGTSTLGDAVEIAYAVDLPSAVRDDPPAARALVVADPEGNLPAARAEGDEVARLLRDRLGAPPRRLSQAGATSLSLLSALPEIDVLHFAGHAHHDARAWASALRLADEGRLTVADLLAIPRGPSTVILSACDAARPSEEGSDVSLAQAFVIAGARAVVAPTAPVDDALAGALAIAFHRARASASDDVAAFAAARRAVRAAHPDWPVDVFRVVVP